MAVHYFVRTVKVGATSGGGGEGPVEPSVPTNGTFSYTLNQPAATSAGVYAVGSGKLIRHLWSYEQQPAGTYNHTWDKRNTAGELVAPGNYTVKVLSNRMQGEWKGVVGNTSTSFTGPTVHRSFEFANTLLVHNNFVYFSTGYAEKAHSAAKLRVNDIQKRVEVLPADGGTGQATLHSCRSGNTIYYAGVDPFASNKSFVFAVETGETDAQKLFSSGEPYLSEWGTQYESVIGMQQNTGYTEITGLAVQTTGVYLFVARASRNQIAVLNRTTGALVRTVSMTEARHMEISPTADNDLWIITDTNTVKKYTINTNGTLTATTTVLAGLVQPRALAFTADGNTLATCDCGLAVQQVVACSPVDGTVQWTLGQAGGYGATALVTNERFMFNAIAGGFHNQALAFGPDNSLWVVDPGNYRLLHFSAAREYQEKVIWQQVSYNVPVDLTDPTNLFNQYLRFKRNYTIELGPNNGSWEHTHNYRHKATTANFDALVNGSYSDITAFISPITLSNGRVYALMSRPAEYRKEIVELTDSGIRFSGELLEGNIKFHPDGSLRVFKESGTYNAAYWVRRAFTGFTGSGWPIHGEETNLASIAQIQPTDPWDHDGTHTCQTTSNGKVVSFDRGGPQVEYNYGLGNHLGALAVGGTDWLWQTAKPTSLSYTGDLPLNGDFDIGNGVNLSKVGGDVMVAGNIIIWNHCGEFWKQSQTNMYYVVNHDGLHLFTFGVVRNDNIDPPAMAGLAGNSFNTHASVVGNSIYTHNNDEFFHSGIHEQVISGQETIIEHLTNVLVA